jgi:branched-chain amino acid transport system ATP-binding protein
MSAAEPLCVVRNIHTAYGDSKVLFDVSLDILPGECVCLLGRNGVGKSTTMRSIIGLTPPRQGSITFRGQEIAGLPAHRIARLGIGFVPEDRRIFSALSVVENLQVAARPGLSRQAWSVDTIFELFPELREHSHRRGGNLSGGQQQMLTIARTLMTNPDLLLLDEPSEGLAPKITEMLLQQILSLKAQGLTILMAEQNLSFCLRVADRVSVLEKGVVRWAGAAGDFAADKALQDNFLAV